MNAMAVVVSVIISPVISHFQIIDLRDPGKSQYLDFNNCIIIRLPVCFQIEITSSKLKEAICHVSHESVY